MYTCLCVCGQTQHAESLTRSHLQMTEAKRQIEELKADRQMSVAVAKRDFHVQLEARDDELRKCRKVITQMQTESDALKASLEQANQSGRYFIGVTCTLTESAFRLAS